MPSRSLANLSIDCKAASGLRKLCFCLRTLVLHLGNGSNLCYICNAACFHVKLDRHFCVALVCGPNVGAEVMRAAMRAATSASRFNLQLRLRNCHIRSIFRQSRHVVQLHRATEASLETPIETPSKYKPFSIAEKFVFGPALRCHANTKIKTVQPSNAWAVVSIPLLHARTVCQLGRVGRQPKYM